MQISGLPKSEPTSGHNQKEPMCHWFTLASSALYIEDEGGVEANTRSGCFLALDYFHVLNLLGMFFIQKRSSQISWTGIFLYCCHKGTRNQTFKNYE